MKKNFKLGYSAYKCWLMGLLKLRYLVCFMQLVFLRCAPQTPHTQSKLSLHLFDSTYAVQDKYWQRAAQTLKPKCPTFNTQPFQSSFYRYMKGTANGMNAHLNLHFGRYEAAGGFTFAGNLFIDTLKQSYQIEGYLDSNRIAFFVKDYQYSAVWTGFAHFDAQQHFKGHFFQNRDLKESNFDFHEVPVEPTGVALVYRDCYAKRSCGEWYKQDYDKERTFWVAWLQNG
jgi:hypothetical protein